MFHMDKWILCKWLIISSKYITSTKRKYQYNKTFNQFFQIGTTTEERRSEGLYQTFNELFPITDARNNFVLEFIDYIIDIMCYTKEMLCTNRRLF